MSGFVKVLIFALSRLELGLLLEVCEHLEDYRWRITEIWCASKSKLTLIISRLTQTFLPLGCQTLQKMLYPIYNAYPWLDYMTMFNDVP